MWNAEVLEVDAQDENRIWVRAPRAFPHGLDELVVKIPRSELSHATGTSPVPQPLVVDVGPGGNRHGRALTALVANAVRPRCPIPADEQGVLELVAVLAAGGRVEPGVAHRVAARSYIEERLDDPGLCARDIAAGTGISQRQLSRVFAAAGTTLPKHILARRLDTAYGLLAGGAAPRTALVAARCGFTSLGYFSQVFSTRFGVTAGRLRRSGTAL